MTKYQVTRAELVNHLREQLAFMELSASAFDAGAESEAKRLATAIRVLVHDTGSSLSLLSQLGLKAQLTYIDTAEPINPHNLLPTPGLVTMQVTAGVGGAYVAPLGILSPPRIKPNTPFHAWWNETVTKIGSVEYSRKDFVLTVANKEGGAHVNPKLDRRWAELTRDNALAFMYAEEPDIEKPFERDPALASVRQITYELSRTLKEQLEPPDWRSRDDGDLTAAPTPPPKTAKIGRNDPCWCGSGKKFKKCHGA